MSYPADPDFRAAGQNAWWFVIMPDGSRRYCAISGSLFVRSVQQLLRGNVPANSPTYNGTISGSAVTIDGKIGPNTMKALYAQLMRLGASDGLQNAVQNDGGLLQSISLDTVRAMIWIFYKATPTPLQEAQIVLPPTAVLPLWNTAPANDSTQMTCTLVSGPPSDATQTTTTGVPVSAEGDVKPPYTGPPLHDNLKDPLTVALETPPIGLPRGTSPTRDTTISPVVLAGAGVLLLAVLAAVVVTNQSEKAPRRRRRAR